MQITEVYLLDQIARLSQQRDNYLGLVNQAMGAINACQTMIKTLDEIEPTDTDTTLFNDEVIFNPDDPPQHSALERSPEEIPFDLTETIDEQPKD